MVLEKNYDFISNISFQLKNEKRELESVNGQSNTFRLSIEKFNSF